MKKLGVAVLACAMLALIGCSGSPKELIVGKWKGKFQDKEQTMEFTSDGKVKAGDTEVGTYTVTDDNLEIKIKGLDDKPLKYKIKVSKTELEMTEGSSTTKLTRA
jgi:hypothetical protein